MTRRRLGTLLYALGMLAQLSLMYAGAWYLKAWGFHANLLVIFLAPLPFTALFFIFGWVLRETPAAHKAS